MRAAGPILLGVIGAILFFAVDVDVSGVSISMIGVILLVAAGVWFVVELVNGATGNRTTQRETIQTEDGRVQHRETKVQHHDNTP